MLFNSLEFLIFLPVIVILYFVVSPAYRWLLLLAGSYFFYMCWKAEYVILLLFSTTIDYWVGRIMGKTNDLQKRRKYLVLSLVCNLGLLFTFKYLDFFSDFLRVLFAQLNLHYSIPASKLLLPVGISFYTFQSMSYTIDVYRGLIKPENHFGKFALYVSFFPQLVAGPIERARNLLPQIYKRFEFDYQRAADGLKLMAWGFFKKLVIADRLAVYVDQVYNNPGNYEGIPIILATYFFAFQIYCDFSGYSDIAIGAAQVMGFKLMNNFNRPYYADSIREFWHRWHISLSTWFRDYLYFPLGGSRVGKWRWYYNLCIVFVISGLWHGANWTFLLWGALHGFYILFSIWTQRIKDKIITVTRLAKVPALLKGIRMFITFHLVWFSWIIFRANSLSDAFKLFENMFRLENLAVSQNVAMGKLDVVIALISILILETVHLLQNKGSVRQLISRQPLCIRWCIYYILILSILLFGRFETQQQFIYFQF